MYVARTLDRPVRSLQEYCTEHGLDIPKPAWRAPVVSVELPSVPLLSLHRFLDGIVNPDRG